MVAKALNQGDIGRAMVASLHLRLPDLSREGAESLSRIDDRLAKYDPTEPRDERGRWTTGGGSPVQTPTKNRRNKPTSHKTTARAKAPVHPLQTGLEGLYPRLIHVSNVRATNDNGSEAVCEAVTRQCQITALKEKWSPAEFDSCYEAQDLCTTTLYANRLDPQQSFVIKFPDNSKIEILDDYAKVTHIGGIQLLHPLH